MEKPLTSAQVLKRMRRGDCPTLRGGYSDASGFDDGAIVRSQTMLKLFLKRLIDRPEGTSIHSRWTLAENSKIKMT